MMLTLLICGTAIAITALFVVAKPADLSDAILAGDLPGLPLSDPAAETLPGHGGPGEPIRSDWQLATLDSLTDAEDLLDSLEANGVEHDVYGAGSLLQEFEAKIARLLGFEAAVFCISGTLAPGTALRPACHSVRAASSDSRATAAAISALPHQAAVHALDREVLARLHLDRRVCRIARQQAGRVPRPLQPLDGRLAVPPPDHREEHPARKPVQSPPVPVGRRGGAPRRRRRRRESRRTAVRVGQETPPLHAQQAVCQRRLAPQVGRDDNAALLPLRFLRQTREQVSRGASVQSFGRLVQ